jgi:hypothetical protein
VTQRISRLCLAIVAATVAGSMPAVMAQGRRVTPADQAAGQAWWAHIKTLAHDNMEGRFTGSQGYLRAARYVVTHFEEAHLQPAGVNGYYQPVKFDVTRVFAEKSSLALVVNGVKRSLSIGPDAVLAARANQLKTVTGPLVFIGYGLHLPEAKYDDFDSPEVPWPSLKGKVVVLINGGPADLPMALKSFARTQPLQKALADAGALRAITIPTPKLMDFPWERVVSNSSQSGMRLAPTPEDAAIAAGHPALADQRAPMFAAQFNPAQAEKLFAGSGHSFAEMLALADPQKPLPRFDLKKNLMATVALETGAVESPNIVAKFEGSDPALKNEYVIVSAHLDHLGIGAPIHGRTIYAGAMDDASGVASVIEIAKNFAHQPVPLFPLKKLHVQGLVESTLADDARAVAAEHQIEIAVDPEPDRNSFTRTDQYSFVLAGIPALAMKLGWVAGSPEHKAWRQWLAERYHSTEDNLSQPVDTAAAAQFNSFLGDLARRVANGPGRPHYVASSSFHRFETE